MISFIENGKGSIYSWRVDSPLGRITISGNDAALTGLWFEGQKHFGTMPGVQLSERKTAVFESTGKWLERYFAAKNPGFEGLPPLEPGGSAFAGQVWALLLEIPCGETVTYGELARRYKVRFGSSTSARAVGGAVGRNPILLVIPCHRVIGTGGNLTGYAGGLDRKRSLLELEKRIY